MTRTLTAVLALLVLFAVAECADVAHAATPCVTVRHVSVPNGSAVLDTFTAARFDGQTGDVFNFSGACDNSPPPTPGFAANALTYQQLKYSSDAPGNAPVNNVAVRDFANVAGRISSRDTIHGFAYVGGSTWQMPGVRGDQVFQTVITVPADAALGHLYIFKGVLYGTGGVMGVLSSSPYPIDVSVYDIDAAGRFVPIRRVGASKTNVRMSDAALIYFVTGETANQSIVPALPGRSYVVEVKWHSLPATQRGNFMFSWNG